MANSQEQIDAAQQEPVVLPCCGFTDARAVRWNFYNKVVQCHNCGQVYTSPPAQRTWVGLSEEEKQEWIDAMPYDIEPRHCMILLNVMEVQLKQRNT